MANTPGVSTVGTLLGYAVETTAGTKPTTFNLLNRINSIGEIPVETETIDASALEDKVEKSIEGRGSTGGTYDVVVNATNETIEEWETVIEEYEEAKAAGKEMWFEEYYPALEKAFYTKAAPPAKIPKPAADQNGLLTITMTMTIRDYVGPDTAIVPTEKA